jgi:hypothetical protein
MGTVHAELPMLGPFTAELRRDLDAVVAGFTPDIPVRGGRGPREPHQQLRAAQ